MCGILSILRIDARLTHVAKQNIIMELKKGGNYGRKNEKVHPTFCLSGSGVSSCCNLHNSVPRWDADQRSIGGASELLVGSMARSYHRPFIHSQLVRQYIVLYQVHNN